MPETIEAKELQLVRIFGDEYRFEIPEYQRPYAWTTEQTGGLLDDFLHAMGKVEDARDANGRYSMRRIFIPLAVFSLFFAAAACSDPSPPTPTAEGLSSGHTHEALAAHIDDILSTQDEIVQRLEAIETAIASPPTNTLMPVATIRRTMNVRAGPGTNHPVIGTALSGQQFPITGKNHGLGNWWEIEFAEDRQGWIYGPFVDAANAENVQLAKLIPTPPTPTPTPSPSPIPPTPTPSPPCSYTDCNCSDFTTQREAQDFFIAAGGPHSDPHRLDGDSDGFACESLP